MRIRIRPEARYNRCNDCGLIFNEKNSFYCATHARSPKWVFVELSDKKEGGRIAIHRWRGHRLVVENAVELVSQIKKEDREGIFSIKNYVEGDPEQLKLKVYAESYLNHLKDKALKGKYSDRGVKNVSSLIRHHLMNIFGETDIRDISRGMLVKWAEASKASDKMKNKAMKALREMLNWANENEDRLTKTFAMPFLQVEEAEMPVALHIEQQDQIIASAPPQHQPILQFLAETSHRPSVVRALQVGDIDWEQNVYWTQRRMDGKQTRKGLKAKGRMKRVYPLPRVSEIIRRAVKGRITSPESYVFMHQHPRTKRWNCYTKDFLYKIYCEARNKAGLPKEATLYSFARHSMASQLAEAGANDDQIAMILDNTKMVVRRHYKHIFPQTVANVLEFRDKAKMFPNVSQTGIGEISHE